VTLRDAHSEQAGHRRTGQERWEMMPTKQAPKPTLIVHDLRRLETFISKRDDDYVALKLETSDEQNPEYWLRVHRSDFLNLAEYLAPVHLTLSSHR